MPIYEYECVDCGKRFEMLQKVADSPITECLTCKGKVERLISSPAIQFKGTGWYVTDYARKGKHSPANGNGSEKSSSPSEDKTAPKKAPQDKNHPKEGGPAASAASTSKD